MLSGKSQAVTQPTAMGTLVQASTYGAAIPKIYGMTQSALLAIWAANIRMGGSNKKFKQLKKDVQSYVENIDFLLGSNPIVGVNQLWINGGTIPLEFTSATTSTSPAFLSAGSPPFTIQILDQSGHPEPDPLFNSVIAVTFAVPFTYTFNDYGSTGPQTVTETVEIPLWNILSKGPDPNDCGVSRYYPMVYRWEPSQGPFIDVGTLGYWFGPGNFAKVYFTRMLPATSSGSTPQNPLTHNRLAFETQLGNGDEYSDAGLSAQQIIYPMFAGIESSNIDLGSSGALPSITAEVQGTFGYYPSGDGDFADYIEDVIKSGIVQAQLGVSATTLAGHTPVETGLSAYNLPWVIQKVSDCDGEAFTEGPILYPLNVTKGNFLVVIGISGTPTISDSLSNTWTPVFPGTPGEQVWYAQANATGKCIVTVGGTSTAWQVVLLEIGGVDTFDLSAIGNAAGAVNLTTTGTPGFPEFLLNINLFGSGIGTGPKDPQIPSWPTILSNNNFYQPFPASASGGGRAIDHALTTRVSLLGKVVYNPGVYGVQQNTNYNAVLPDFCCMLAFKCTNAPTYPKPIGNFLDPYSLNLVRQQCRAYGLIGSLVMASQQAASDWLKTLYDAADATPIYAGFQLYSMPLSEVSAMGAGAIYVSPTAAGPSFNLSTENGDFIVTGKDAPIKVTTPARVNQANVLQMQCINRSSNYNPSLVEQPDAASISLFGVRKAEPITNNAIQDVAVARQLLGIQVRKLQYGGDTYSFTLSERWCLLAPMGAGGGGTGDAVITISDPLASIFNMPVRITSISEQPDGTLACQAEPFIYGMYAPTVYGSSTTVPAPYVPAAPVSALIQVNTPIIFEATPRLAQQTSPAQIWCVVSCGDPAYGGCIPYLSTDGGLSYNPVSQTAIRGTAQQGFVSADWPAASDPDTTNNLFIAFGATLPTESNLPTYTPVARDKFQFPAYVGYSPTAGGDAKFTIGDATQITELDMLFTVATLNNALPSDAVITAIYPILAGETIAPPTSPVTAQAYYGTGMTPTTGGSSLEGPITGPGQFSFLTPPSLGTALSVLTGQGIRVRWTLGTTGAAAIEGKALNVGWAIYYTSATPNIDPNGIYPFTPAPGAGFGWATPKTAAVGQVGTGTNGTVVANNGVAPAGIGYEIISYNKTTMIDSTDWEINATGTGNEIRRGVYAAPSPGVGMDHPAGSPFGLLDPGGAGLVKINMDPAWIGTQLWFKFVPLNTFGATNQSLDNTDAFPFTPTGVAGNTGPATGGILVNGS